MKYLFLLLAAALLFGCSSIRPTAVATVERPSHDTLLFGQIHYDSIYIDNWLNKYQQADTVFIERTKLEYKYKLMRDTLYRVRIDSIPVIREVEVRREVNRSPWYIRTLAVIGFFSLILFLVSGLRR